MGRVSRPHGVHGEVRVLPSSDNPERFAPASVLYARPERLGIAGPRLREQVSLTIETVRGDAGFPIVAFRDVADRDAAEALRGHVLEIRSNQLPDLDEGEYYPFDLIGLEARDPEGVVVGRVIDVVESPAHALLVISSGAGAETMIPFVLAAVPTVAVAEGFVVISPSFLGGTEELGDGEESGERDDADVGRGPGGAIRR
ncbi:MAG: ribosome maturation factor RimM [bacterium]